MDRKITAANVSGELAVDILRDLISEGYSGQELLEKFIDIKNKIPLAFDMMMSDVDDMVARGEYYTMEEVFGEDDDEEWWI